MDHGTTRSRCWMGGDSGFSLVELVIALTVGMLLLAAMNGVLILQRRALNIEEQAAEMHENVRVAMNMMVREVRLAGYDPLDGGGVDSVTIGTDLDSIEFSYYAEDGTLRTVVFDLADTGGRPSLRRAEPPADPEPLVENIESVVFDYDTASNVLTITLTGRTDRPDRRYTHPVENDPYRRYTLVSTVACRNLQL